MPPRPPGSPATRRRVPVEDLRRLYPNEVLTAEEVCEVLGSSGGSVRRSLHEQALRKRPPGAGSRSVGVAVAAIGREVSALTSRPITASRYPVGKC